MSLDLTLTQHLCDENLKPRDVHPCLEIEPLQAWYYKISPNSHTLVILLQVDPTSNDEFEIICKGFYKIRDTLIFAWFSTPVIGYYHWLLSSIHQLFLTTRWIT